MSKRQLLVVLAALRHQPAPLAQHLVDASFDAEFALQELYRVMADLARTEARLRLLFGNITLAQEHGGSRLVLAHERVARPSSPQLDDAADRQSFLFDLAPVDPGPVPRLEVVDPESALSVYHHASVERRHARVRFRRDHEVVGGIPSQAESALRNRARGLGRTLAEGLDPQVWVVGFGHGGCSFLEQGAALTILLVGCPGKRKPSS